MTTPLELLKSRLENYNPNTICWIAGGGPSFKTHIKTLQSILSDKDKHSVIAVNNSYKIFPYSILTHFADIEWWRWHTTETQNILRDFKGPITTSILPQLRYEYPDRVIRFKLGEKFWLSMSETNLNGNNSGHQALNLAVLLGFKEIRLLGFDLDVESGVTHWHQEHQRPTNKGNFEASMIPGFDSILPKYYEGINIVNFNPSSKISAFKKESLDSWLESGFIQ